MDLYAEIILDHYKNPHHRGVLEKSTCSAEDSNPLCGDKIRMDVRVNGDLKIEEIAFSGEGCAISQASASMLCDEVTGKPLAEVMSLNTETITEMLQVPLTPARMKCALLSLVVLKKTIMLYNFSRQ